MSEPMFAVEYEMGPDDRPHETGFILRDGVRYMGVFVTPGAAQAEVDRLNAEDREVR